MHFLLVFFYDIILVYGTQKLDDIDLIHMCWHLICFMSNLYVFVSGYVTWNVWHMSPYYGCHRRLSFDRKKRWTRIKCWQDEEQVCHSEHNEPKASILQLNSSFLVCVCVCDGWRKWSTKHMLGQWQFIAIIDDCCFDTLFLFVFFIFFIIFKRCYSRKCSDTNCSSCAKVQLNTLRVSANLIIELIIDTKNGT